MTEVSLRKHIDTQIKWINRYFEAKIKWIDRYFESKIKEIRSIIEKAEGELKVRLLGMNEFRDTLKDQAANFVTRAEMELKNIEHARRLVVLEQQAAVSDAKTLELKDKAKIAAIWWSTVTSIGTSTIVGLVLKYII